nr:polysaccharide deacetylase family protein [Natronolimnobius sp. AArcel1]
MRFPPKRRIKNSRHAWKLIIDLFDHYSVPATWAVVGHLLFEDCDGDHMDHPAGGTGWFDSDPGADSADRDRWFAPDLVDAVDNARVDHEIGCHSFSHVLFDDDRTDAEVIDAELERCTELARDTSLSCSSFVFPRNVVGFREKLAAHGFSAYRGVSPPRAYEDSLLYHPKKFATYTTGDTPPPLVDPTVDEYGLVNIPASFDLYSLEGLARKAALRVGEEDPTVRQAKMGIDAAAEESGLFHIWLHPNNLVYEHDFERLRAVISYIAEQRDRGRITVETMADVTQRTLETHHG